MDTVYMLYHYKIAMNDDYLEIDPDDLDDKEKYIGLFSSVEKAEEAIGTLKEKAGFRDWPDGFRIKFGVVDSYAWKDGFISWDEAHKGDDAS